MDGQTAKQRERTGRIGQYRLIRKIGSGGTGDVYLCRHIILDNSYAMKILHNSGDAEAQGRMLREARIARRIRHRNLVPVLDANVSVSGDAAYIVMEYIDGETLDKLLEDGPLPEPAALYICRCVTQVLIEAAKHGIVHRDIKPANILIDRNGEVKLTDLGIAKVDPANIKYDEPATCEESVLGTPDYASPEQLRDSSTVDERADIYSLGATLYHMLSGRKPFAGSGVFNLMAQVLEKEPEELHNVSEGTAALVAKMMAKNPADRPQSALQLMKELRKVSRRSIRQTPEIRRFLSGSTKRLFSIQNFRFLRRMRDIFITAGALFFALMICAWLWSSFKDKLSGQEKNAAAILLEKPDASTLVSRFRNGELPEKELIAALVAINDTGVVQGVLNALPELAEDKKYAKIWLDGCSKKEHRKLLALLLSRKLDVNNAVSTDGTSPAFRRTLFFDAQLLRLLLRNGLKTDVTDTSGRTPLIRLAEFRTSSVECADLFLKSGVPLNARSRNGSSAFNAAVASGNLPLIRYLLKCNIAITHQDVRKIPDIYVLKSQLAAKLEESKKTPPQEKVEKAISVLPEKPVAPALPAAKVSQPVPEVAVERKVMPAATEEFLKKSGEEKRKCAELEEERSKRKKTIDQAASQKFLRKVEVYIQTSPAERVPLTEEQLFIDRIIAELRQGNLDPDSVVGRTPRPLLQVVSDNKLPPRRLLFAELLAAGADPNSITLPDDPALRRRMLEYGRSKFEKGELSRVLAGFSPDWESAQIMLLRGADPSVKDPVTGNNAYHRAAGLGNVEFLKLLISSGKSGLFDENGDGLTPYQLAIVSGKGATAHVLKKSFPESRATGAMYNAGALFRAIETDSADETAYRLKLDGDPQKLNAMGLNALQYAAKIGSRKAAQVLLKNKVSPNGYRKDQPLKFAVENCDSELFILLISHGADPDIEVTDIFGRKSLLFTGIFRCFADAPEKMYQCFEAMLKHKWNPLVKTPAGDTPLDWMEKWNAGSEPIRKLLRDAIDKASGAVEKENSKPSENL